MPDKYKAVLGVSSSAKDVVNGQRRIRICGVVLVPADFPETDDWEKWAAEITIEPIRRFVSKYPLGEVNNVIISLGPTNKDQWKKKVK